MARGYLADFTDYIGDVLRWVKLGALVLVAGGVYLVPRRGEQGCGGVPGRRASMTARLVARDFRPGRDRCLLDCPRQSRIRPHLHRKAEQ